jgi:hypothetical protein
MHYDTCIDDSQVNKEVQDVFSGHTGSLAPSMHEDVINRANRLLTTLRSKPLPMSLPRRKRRRPTACEKHYQRNLVIVDFPGAEAPDVQKLHDWDKVYEGTLSFDTSMSERDIRDEVSRLVSQKQSIINDYRTISGFDFEFVKCVNRKIRVPDGDTQFDGSGLRRVYPSGAVYMRLTKSFTKHTCEVCVCIVYNKY